MRLVRSVPMQNAREMLMAKSHQTSRLKTRMIVIELQMRTPTK